MDRWKVPFLGELKRMKLSLGLVMWAYHKWLHFFSLLSYFFLIILLGKIIIKNPKNFKMDINLYLWVS